MLLLDVEAEDVSEAAVETVGFLVRLVWVLLRATLCGLGCCEAALGPLGRPLAVVAVCTCRSLQPERCTGWTSCCGLRGWNGSDANEGYCALDSPVGCGWTGVLVRVDEADKESCGSCALAAESVEWADDSDKDRWRCCCAAMAAMAPSELHVSSAVLAGIRRIFLVLTLSCPWAARFTLLAVAEAEWLVGWASLSRLPPSSSFRLRICFVGVALSDGDVSCPAVEVIKPLTLRKPPPTLW